MAPDNFQQLREQIEVASQQLDKAHNQDCVVVIGDTGGGKSTIINSILFGIDQMEEVLEEVKSLGGFGTIMRKNIKPKNWMQDERTELFKVSSDPLNSCTSYPEVCMYDNHALCDCPGFGDSKGFEKDLVNCIAIGRLLNRAQSVRLAIVLSYNTITTVDGRGAGVVSMIKTLSSIFKNGTNAVVDFASLAKVLIVVNKAPLGKEGTDDEPQINLVRDTMFQNLTTVFKISEQEARAIAKNCVIVDPRDRIHPDFATPIASLWDMIKNQPAIASDLFQVPMTAKMLAQLAKISNNVHQAIQEHLSRYDFDGAREQVEPLQQLIEFGIETLQDTLDSHLALISHSESSYAEIVAKEAQMQELVEENKERTEQIGYLSEEMEKVRGVNEEQFKALEAQRKVMEEQQLSSQQKQEELNWQVESLKTKLQAEESNSNEIINSLHKCVQRQTEQMERLEERQQQSQSNFAECIQAIQETNTRVTESIGKMVEQGQQTTKQIMDLTKAIANRPPTVIKKRGCTLF